MGYNLKSSFPESESKTKIIQFCKEQTYHSQQNLKEYCYNLTFHSVDLCKKHSYPMSKAGEEEILKTYDLEIQGSRA